MKYAYLGKETVENMENVYEIISLAFEFPDYFGKNLDALYDCLTDGTEERLVLISDREYLKETLGTFYDKLYGVIFDAAEEKDNVRIRILE